MYKGVVYNECIDLEYGGKSWCANDCLYADGNFYRGTCSDRATTAQGIGEGVGAINTFFAILLAVASKLDLVVYSLLPYLYLFEFYSLRG